MECTMGTKVNLPSGAPILGSVDCLYDYQEGQGSLPILLGWPFTNIVTCKVVNSWLLSQARQYFRIFTLTFFMLFHLFYIIFHTLYNIKVIYDIFVLIIYLAWMHMVDDHDYLDLVCTLCIKVLKVKIIISKK